MALHITFRGFAAFRPTEYSIVIMMHCQCRQWEEARGIFVKSRVNDSEPHQVCVVHLERRNYYFGFAFPPCLSEINHYRYWHILSSGSESQTAVFGQQGRCAAANSATSRVRSECEWSDPDIYLIFHWSFKMSIPTPQSNVSHRSCSQQRSGESHQLHSLGCGAVPECCRHANVT